jgi:hypothetical protein
MLQVRAEANKAAKAAGTTVAQYWNNRWTSEDIYEDMLDSQSDVQEGSVEPKLNWCFYKEDAHGDPLVYSIMFDDGSLFLCIYDGEKNGVRTCYHQPFDTIAEAKEWLAADRSAKAVDTRLRESQATLKETLKNTAENFKSAEGQK